MTESTSPSPTSAAADSAAASYAPVETEPRKPQSRSFIARTLREAFRRWGARLGLLWVITLVIAAVFAPFIANSHPIVITVDGETSSPALRHFEPPDVVLLVAFFVGLPLIFFVRRLSFAARVWILIGVLAVTVGFALWLVQPPRIIEYQQWRVLQQDDQHDVGFVINALVPFSPSDRMRDAPAEPFQPPSWQHPFGTTERGEDVFSRMVWASRVALGIGFVATGIALFIGILVGGLMGYFSGVVDMLGMRLVEIFESVPTLFLLLTFVAFFGSNLYMMMVIIGLTSWSGYARMLRAEFLKLRAQEYVQAAQALGLPLRSVLFRHMLPNGVAPLLVQASFGVAVAILAEATLSFLGLGPVDAPSWGQMLNQAVQASSFNWWMAVFPGGAIFLTVFAYNLMGEAMRDALDPYLKKTAA